MTSIRTNSSALISMQALEAVNKALETTRNRVSTGKRISSPADGSAVWAVAKTMEGDRNTAKVIQYGLKAAEKVTSIAVDGAETVTDQIIRIHGLLLDTADEHNDPGKILHEIREIVDNMGTTISSANFNGVNLLSHKGVGGVDKDAYTVIASLDRGYGEAQTKTSVIEVGSANLEISPLVELRNLFLFKGDHDSTIDPVMPGTPVGDSKIAIVKGVNLTQSEFADLISAAEREQSAFRAIASTAFPSEAAKEDYRQAFSAYYNAVIKDAGLTDAQKAELRQKKDNAVEAMLRSRGTPNRVLKRFADEAIAEFHAAARNAGLKSPTKLAAIANTYRNSDGTGKRGIYQSVYPPNIEEVEFDDSVALKLIKTVEALLETTISKGAKLGAKHQRIVSQAETLSRQVGSLDIGIGALIDANMDEESARLKALQIQQLLATQSLSIANQSPNSVLSLFN